MGQTIVAAPTPDVDAPPGWVVFRHDGVILVPAKRPRRGYREVVTPPIEGETRIDHLTAVFVAAETLAAESGVGLFIQGPQMGRQIATEDARASDAQPDRRGRRGRGLTPIS